MHARAHSFTEFSWHPMPVLLAPVASFRFTTLFCCLIPPLFLGRLAFLGGFVTQFCFRILAHLHVLSQAWRTVGFEGDSLQSMWGRPFQPFVRSPYWLCYVPRWPAMRQSERASEQERGRARERESKRASERLLGLLHNGNAAAAPLVKRERERERERERGRAGGVRKGDL